MATTTILEAEKWTANQNQPEVTVNESFDVFDAAIAGELVHNVSSDANYSLGTTGDKPQEWMYDKIKITDTSAHLTTQRTIFVPTNAKKYVFENATAQELLVKTSAFSGVVVDPGRTNRLRCTGSTVVSNESFLFQGSQFKGYQETLVSVEASGNDISLSCASANVFDVYITANSSIIFTDVPSVGKTTFTTTVFYEQDGGGGNTVTVPGAIYASGVASTVSQQASALDVWIYTTKDSGNTWYAFAAGLSFS